MKQTLSFSIIFLLLLISTPLMAEEESKPLASALVSDHSETNIDSSKPVNSIANGLDYGRSQAAPGGVGVRDFLTTFIALLFVLFLIGAIAWMLRRSGLVVANNSSIIRVLSTTHLSSKEKLVLVEVAGEQILLAVCPGQIQRITTLKEPIVTENEVKQDFSPLLSRLLKK